MMRGFFGKYLVFMLVILIAAIGFSMVGCEDVEEIEDVDEVDEVDEVEEDEYADYPTGSLDAICPWTAGGGSDVAFRGFLSYMAKELGVDINVTNVTGGNGAIGWAELAESEPDGYTLGLLTFDILTNDAMGTSPNTYEDYDIISQFTAQGTVLITHADFGYENLDDFIAAAEEAEETGERMQIGVAGEGGVWHQAAALMAKEIGTEDAFIYVPFEGSADQLADLLGKHVDAIVATTTASIDHIEEGTLTLLAAMSEERLSEFPDAPTFQELGYDVIYESWRCVVVPAGTPEPILEILREAGEAAYNNPDFQEWAVDTDIGKMYRDHEAARQFISNQRPVVRDVMDELGLIGQ